MSKVDKIWAYHAFCLMSCRPNMDIVINIITDIDPQIINDRIVVSDSIK